ncbi:diversity-generating retroelement protein Avd [bacterium]|nr:diversity-generating retroelement protein Avd [bacterium]
MNPPRQETPLFAKLHDLLLWLTPCIEKFPRSQRFLLAERILDTAFACQENLIRARKVNGAAKAEALLHADIELEKLRMQWRLAHELRCVSTGQYEHGGRLIDEIGRLLGAWRK